MDIKTSTEVQRCKASCMWHHDMQRQSCYLHTVAAKQPRAFTQHPVTAPVNQTTSREEAGDAEDDGKRVCHCKEAE